MPAKRKPTELPTAVQQLKDALGGKPITADSIASLPADLRKNAFSALNSTLKATMPDVHAQYSEEKNLASKREWLAAFTIDPSSGGATAKNINKRTHKNAEEEDIMWLHESELSGPKYLNSESHAKDTTATRNNATMHMHT